MREYRLKIIALVFSFWSRKSAARREEDSRLFQVSSPWFVMMMMMTTRRRLCVYKTVRICYIQLEGEEEKKECKVVPIKYKQGENRNH